MKIYAPVTEAVLDALKTIVGAEYVLTEPEKLEQYQTDEETDPRKFHLPEAVVLPKDAQEIAAVIKLANTYDVPVTVRSGGTGWRRYSCMRRYCPFNGTVEQDHRAECRRHVYGG